MLRQKKAIQKWRKSTWVTQQYTFMDTCREIQQLTSLWYLDLHVQHPICCSLAKKSTARSHTCMPSIMSCFIMHSCHNLVQWMMRPSIGKWAPTWNSSTVLVCALCVPVSSNSENSGGLKQHQWAASSVTFHFKSFALVNDSGFTSQNQWLLQINLIN